MKSKSKTKVIGITFDFALSKLFDLSSKKKKHTVLPYFKHDWLKLSNA